MGNTNRFVFVIALIKEHDQLNIVYSSTTSPVVSSILPALVSFSYVERYSSTEQYRKYVLILSVVFLQRRVGRVNRLCIRAGHRRV